MSLTKENMYEEEKKKQEESDLDYDATRDREVQEETRTDSNLSAGII